MKMEKEQLNKKVDKETTLSAIKASYINSYKVIVCRDVRHRGEDPFV